MTIERLLGDVPTSTFVEDHFLRLPFSLPGGAQDFTDMGTWETLERALAADEPDVLVAREGERWAEERVPSPDEARQLYADGYTILVRHVERHDPRLAELAKGFRKDFLGTVDVHLYCTPAGRHGFGWHYDAEDVFLLQTVGSKEYALRKNTVNPWPLIETLPADMQFHRELMPLMQCLLAAGDWLYVPHGYWHVGRAEEDAITLAVGVMMPTALDVFDILRNRLRDSLPWRRRLPVLGAAQSKPHDELLEDLRTILAELGQDLDRNLNDEATLRILLRSLGAEDATDA